MQILTKEANQAIADFVKTGIFMGVILAACTGFAAIKMAGRIPLSLYLIMLPAFPICVATDFVFIMLTAPPAENTFKFKHFWRGRRLKRLSVFDCVCVPLLATHSVLLKNVRKRQPYPSWMLKLTELGRWHCWAGNPR